MRPGGIGRAAGVHDRQLAAIPQRLQRGETRIEAEETVEIECAVRAAGRPADGDSRPGPVVVGLTVRHDDAQAVDRAALEDGDELCRAPGRAGGERRACEKRRREAEADQRERAVLQEDPSGCHGFTVSETPGTPAPVLHAPARQWLSRSSPVWCPTG